MIKEKEGFYGFGGCKNIDEFIKKQLSSLKKTDESFSQLFNVMFSVKENVMFEFNDGNKICTITYGECLQKIKYIATNLDKKLSSLNKNSIVGLYMDNSAEWIQIFWAILMAGFRPLLLNKRVNKDQLLELLKNYNVEFVVSDEDLPKIKNIIYTDLLKEEDILQNFEWADEIILMTSGTSLNFKLCAYSGRNICNQIYNTTYITKKSRLIKKHYNGKLKILTFLPFYHVFGLIACYMWFAFFSRTFVLLKDLSGETILNTVKKHKVTHLFAVPLLWEKIAATAKKKISERGEKTEKKFLKAIKFSNKLQNICPSLGRMFAKKVFKELRSSAFGDSIQFLITGGGLISLSVLEMFNGVGYRLANGYGMTEIGITSVELSNKTKWLNSGSVGEPLPSVEFKIVNNELLVKGASSCCKILNNNEQVSDCWFKTGDVVREKKNHFYIIGRVDDLIVGSDGENICPDEIESKIKIEDAKVVLLSLKKETSKTVLIVSVNKYFSNNKILEIKNKLFESLSNNNIGKIIDEIYFTFDSLLQGKDIKISRKNLIKRIEEKSLTLTDITEIENRTNNVINSDLEKEIALIFEDLLNKKLTKQEYALNFFYELGGDSLLYFSIVEMVKTKYGISLPLDNESIVSVYGICSYIQDRIN